MPDWEALKRRNDVAYHRVFGSVEEAVIAFTRHLEESPPYL